MQSVVFLRGVNVGGRQLKTQALAEALRSLDVVNIGAAGTFVVRRAPDTSQLRTEFIRRISFPVEMIVEPAEAVVRLVETERWGSEELPEGERWAVSVLDRPPAGQVELPLVRPMTGDWQVKVLERRGRFVLSRRRRVDGARMIYPNEVVEQAFGVPATTRWWETIAAVYSALERVPAGKGRSNPAGEAPAVPRPTTRPPRTVSRRPTRVRG